MNDAGPDLDTLVSLAKRRGFVWPASEIYGGLAGFYDLGPYGAQLARNIKEAWWNHFVKKRPNIYGLDSAIIQNPKLWEASGHVAGFNDPMVECQKCHTRYRQEQLDTSKPCENCGQTDSFGDSKTFNMMFKTSVGPVKGDDAAAYLRPETAGAIFADFDHVKEVTRAKLPFGIAQIGKAFRNEISPRDFIFRLRELEQMELEYFVYPQHAGQELSNMKQICWDWLTALGLNQANLSWYQHTEDERAHYAVDSWDINYAYPFGQKELWGIANRTDFDLQAHSKASGKELNYFDPETNTHITPYVIEPSIGVERLLLAVLHSAYYEEEVKGEKRVVLKFDAKLAPVQVAVLPLSKTDKLTPLAHQVYQRLNESVDGVVEYDETQSIGRRYRRQDEIGTPKCVTIDFESLNDQQVTIRERDTMEQKRVKIEELSKEVV
ncbi:MAG TPA: glycine--tRNA ligase [Candidatus Saccharimonadales bacterium]